MSLRKDIGAVGVNPGGQLFQHGCGSVRAFALGADEQPACLRVRTGCQFFVAQFVGFLHQIFEVASDLYDIMGEYGIEAFFNRHGNCIDIVAAQTVVQVFACGGADFVAGHHLAVGIDALNLSVFCGNAAL